MKMEEEEKQKCKEIALNNEEFHNTQSNNIRSQLPSFWEKNSLHENSQGNIEVETDNETKRDLKLDNITHTEQKIAIIHNDFYSHLLHRVTNPLHGDRDILLSALLQCCGFLNNNSSDSLHSILKSFPPKRATLDFMQAQYHSRDYLEMLQFEQDEDYVSGKAALLPIYPNHVLDSYGLTDDCPLPSTPSLRSDLWQYCQYTAGSSLFAAHLLTSQKSKFEVAINWGGGRHHAQPSKANGFCYVNDVVLAIKYSICKSAEPKLLYVDIDIHHGDAVQSAFYETNKVLTCSFHRYAKSFFPYPMGSTKEKGRGDGLGYNVNIPLPKNCTDGDFNAIFQDSVMELVGAYKPNMIVMCVGTDGLKGDPLVKGMGDDGWSLSPKGISDCIKFVSEVSSKNEIRLLLLGGGGYKDTKAALTYLLCTAAAFEGVQPGTMEKLPRDVPNHDFFCRYGPSFELILENENNDFSIKRTPEYEKVLEDGKRSALLAAHYIRGKELDNKSIMRPYTTMIEGETNENNFWEMGYSRKKKKRRSKRRKVKGQDNK